MHVVAEAVMSDADPAKNPRYQEPAQNESIRVGDRKMSNGQVLSKATYEKTHANELEEGG